MNRWQKIIDRDLVYLHTHTCRINAAETDVSPMRRCHEAPRACQLNLLICGF